MRKAFTLLPLLVAFHFGAHGQQLVDVADLTLRLGANETKELYYSFAKDDQIVFNFEEADHKAVKEIDVTEATTGTKRFEDYESVLVKDKALLVSQKGVYKFRLYNAAMFKGRVCKLRIQRLPASAATQRFNTAVKWVDQADTAYTTHTKKVVTGNREYEVQKSRRVLARVDTSVAVLLDRQERVYGTLNLNGSSTSRLNFTFPVNTATPNLLFPDRTTEVVSWAYTLGVGDAGAVWYKDANKRATVNKAVGTAISAGLVSGGTGAVAMLAIAGVSVFTNPPKGDNVLFYFGYSLNGNNYVLNEGKGNSVTAFGRCTTPTQGGLTLNLTNDNTVDAINVTVKVVAVVVTKTYKDEQYTVKKSQPIEETKTFRDPSVTYRKVPVTMD
jgi:hypothetical protein